MALLVGLIILGTGASLLCFMLLHNLRRNIAIARNTGLSYVIVPFYITSGPWLLLQPIIYPLFDKLPAKWTQEWLPFLYFGTAWNQGYLPFHLAGADTFVAVSPGGNVIHTCDPEVSNQIFRRNEFTKPVELIELLNVFGPGLTGSEGDQGRLYRKITAPFFTEQTMDQVWRTSMNNIRTLMRDLMVGSVHGSSSSLRSMIARMTLHNLLTVCITKRSEPEFNQSQGIVEKDHKMGFHEAVLSVLDNFVTLASIPKPMLKFSPFPNHYKIYRSSSEVHDYLYSLQASTRSSVPIYESAGNQDNLLDLLTKAGLPPPAIAGNIFSFLFAGHEANANTLTVAIFLLALQPAVQNSLQRTIDLHLAGAPSQKSTYATHYNRLKESLVTAVINETLRLFTILPFLPKTTPKQPSPITIGEKTHILPPRTLVLINTSATHRHAAYWPSPQEPCRDAKPHPVSSFNPMYWLERPGDTHFFRPKPGSFLPFSDGGRGCLGRQFAMVELCAQLVGIFSEWRVELIVNENERWEEAKRRGEEALSSGMTFDMTLRPGKMIPVKFLRRDAGVGGEACDLL